MPPASRSAACASAGSIARHSGSALHVPLAAVSAQRLGLRYGAVELLRIGVEVQDAARELVVLDAGVTPQLS